MAKELTWSEEMDCVFGCSKDFSSEADFIKTVKSQYGEGECDVVDVKVQTCLYSEQTLYADTLIPLSAVNVYIENYYTAEVVPLEPVDD